jgi:undecaprenyl-diphosphatase
MPTMAAATVYDLLKFLRHGGMAAMNRHEWIILFIGFVVSFFVAWGVVAWFMHWVRRHGFVPFAVYRILAGVVVLVWLSRLM